MTNQILQSYVKLTDFLSQTLGPDYEVALYDLTDENRPIIAIANGYISGREIGMPLADTERLMEENEEISNYYLHRPLTLPDGRTLRSSALLLKNGQEYVGMLCISFDDMRYQNVSRDILNLCHPEQFVAQQFDPLQHNAIADPKQPLRHGSRLMGSVAENAIAQELARLGITADRLTAEERMQIISVLDSNGIFLLKGAVKDVADAMQCSQASVYRYLSQIRRENVALCSPSKPLDTNNHH